MSSGLSRQSGSRQTTPERVPSWEEVPAEHGRFVYSLAYRLTGSPADAEDLAQDVLLRVRSALAQYRPGSLEGWLLRITTNLFYDRMRHRARHPVEPLDSLDDPADARVASTSPTPEDSALNGELSTAVQQALAALPG